MAASSKRNGRQWTAPRVAWILLMGSFMFGVAAIIVYKDQLEAFARADASDTLLREAGVAEQYNDLARAEALLRNAVDRREPEQRALLAMAVFYDTHGMTDKADAAYARAVAAAGRNAPVLTRYAFFLERENRRDRLVTMCRAYLERFPNDARANLHYGLGLFRQGEAEGCIEPLKNAAASSAYAIDALSALGDAYQKLNRPAEAIETREKVLSLSDSPDAKQILYDMGLAYRSMEQPLKAIEVLERHLQLFPRSLWTLQALHDLYAASGNAGEAARMRILRERLTPPMPIDRMLDLGTRVLGIAHPPENAEPGASISFDLYVLFTTNARNRAMPDVHFRASNAETGLDMPIDASPTRLGPGPRFRGDVLIESFALTIPPRLASGRHAISIATTPGTGPIPLWMLEVKPGSGEGGVQGS